MKGCPSAPQATRPHPRMACIPAIRPSAGRWPGSAATRSPASPPRPCHPSTCSDRHRLERQQVRAGEGQGQQLDPNGQVQVHVRKGRCVPCCSAGQLVWQRVWQPRLVPQRIWKLARSDGLRARWLGPRWLGRLRMRCSSPVRTAILPPHATAPPLDTRAHALLPRLAVVRDGRLVGCQARSERLNVYVVQDSGPAQAKRDKTPGKHAWTLPFTWCDPMSMRARGARDEGIVAACLPACLCTHCARCPAGVRWRILAAFNVSEGRCKCHHLLPPSCPTPPPPCLLFLPGSTWHSRRVGANERLPEGGIAALREGKGWGATSPARFHS